MGFRRPLLLGYSTSFAITVAVGVFAVIALRASASNQKRLVHQYGDELLRVERLRFQAERIIATARGYLITRERGYLERLAIASSELDGRLGELEAMPLAPTSAVDLAVIGHSAGEYVDAARKVANEGTTNAARAFERVIQPERTFMQRQLDSLASRERAAFETALARSRHDTSRAGVVVGTAGGFALALSALLAAVVIRRLGRQHREQQHATDVAKLAADGRAEMLAIVSHDLRGPLGTVMLSADLLSLKLAATPGLLDSARELAAIQTAAEHMERLVDQVLNLAQIDQGTLQLELGEHDVDTMLRVAIDLVAVGASRRQITASAELLGVAVAVHADKNRVLEVLVNLVDNALKFTPRGGSVTLRARQQTTAIELSVEDTGSGIPADRVPRLFDRYWQGEGTRAGTGVGLGLYICKKLIEAHGGRIWVDTHARTGACFRFTLPLVARAELAHEPQVLRSAAT